MGRFVRGDVVVVPFPFTDLTANKKRPALVIAPLEGNDVILCQITTKGRGLKHSIPLSTRDFLHGSLRELSFVRPEKIFTADERIVEYQRGALKPEKIQEVISRIIEIIST